MDVGIVGSCVMYHRWLFVETEREVDEYMVEFLAGTNFVPSCHTAVLFVSWGSTLKKRA